MKKLIITIVMVILVMFFLGCTKDQPNNPIPDDKSVNNGNPVVDVNTPTVIPPITQPPVNPTPNPADNPTNNPVNNQPLNQIDIGLSEEDLAVNQVSSDDITATDTPDNIPSEPN